MGSVGDGKNLKKGKIIMSPGFSSHENTPPLTIVLTLILLVFLFVGFFSIYFCRCVMESILHSRRRSPSSSLPSSASPPSAPSGLDPALISSFPTFPYSGIRDLRHDKFPLECAICLLEFDDLALLRLLTACCHVFHQECIDLWLESHKTCPVCRGDLDRPPRPDDAVSIEIDHADAADRDLDDPDPPAPAPDRFSRSHSTGHSIVKKKDTDPDPQDRYTLRLPEHVKIKIVRGHNWTGSCVTFEEFSRNPSSSGGFLEVSESQHTLTHNP